MEAKEEVSAIEPALTAAEWAEIKRREESPHPPFEVFMAESGVHGKVAWMLHEQPFGFTRDDVELLGNVHSNHSGCDENVCWAVDLADRIEALLPPPQKQCQWLTVNVAPPGNRCRLAEGHDGECEFPAMLPPEEK